MTKQQQPQQLVPGGGGEEDVGRQVVMGRWRSSLSSGLRAALACTIVGLVSLYAPAGLRRHITFPAFSYVVTVIIVSDATLGTALRGAVSAVHATLMGAAPSVLALWLAHRTGAAESVLATSALVALTTFAVALPESVGPVAKRIALGQIIIIYVAKFQHNQREESFALLHPANVVICTALGVAAALLAVLVPWPRLATSEAREKRRTYKLLAAERVRLMADAFEYSSTAACRRQRRWRMAACVSEAKRLASASTMLLHRINSIAEDARWERALPEAAGVCKWVPAADQDVDMETPLTGMEMALAMMIHYDHHHEDDMVDLVRTIKDQIRLALLAPNTSSGSSKQSIVKIISSKPLLMSIISRGYDEQQLAPLLFLFSLSQLHRRTTTTSNSNANKQTEQHDQDQQAADSFDEQQEEDFLEQEDDRPPAKEAKESKEPAAAGFFRRLYGGNGGRVMSAAKCGFSLGLAVLLGLLFSNDHGFWSGLIVATTMTAGRESTWAVGIARAHGTALGSVYGVLGCLLISQSMDLRFVGLLPWMVLATFLKRSRAYGPAGGLAAALSGVIIMGRRYEEAPMAFTIARLVETFIGIACVILVDMVFQPGARPSVQAWAQLTRCIATLAHCFPNDIAPTPSLIQQQLGLLRKVTAEARSEPTYLWLPPFPAAAYDKIEGSLSRTAQLLHLYLQARASTSGQLEDDDNEFTRVVSTSLNHCLLLLATNNNNNSSSHSQTTPDVDDDLEAGHGTTKCSCCSTTLVAVAGSFLAHAKEALELKESEAAGLEACCLASMGFCMGHIIKEALSLEAHVLDLTLQPR